MSAPISCSDYEVLEVACMHRYEVTLTLDDGQVTGTALDIAVRSPDEFLQIDRGDGQPHEIHINRIRHLRVLTRPSRFGEHQFG